MKQQRNTTYRAWTWALILVAGLGLGLVRGTRRTQAALPPPPPNTRVVTNTTDNEPGSLRQAIAAAQSGDTITFQLSYPAVITLTTGELLINKTLTIQGPGAKLLTVSGNQISRVFNISGGVTVTIDALTIANGKVSSGGGADVQGGGIYNSGTLKLTHCVVTGNSLSTYGSNSGGGIFTTGTLTLSNSMVTNNSSGISYGGENNGGGIYQNGGMVELLQTTVAGNAGTGSGLAYGGGIYTTGGTLRMTNSTISGNGNYNASGCAGGGIYNAGSTISTTNCTIVGNIVSGASSSRGGGVFGAITARNTLIAGNVLSSGQPFGPDVYGTLDSQGYNLIGDPADSSGYVGSDLQNVDPKLAPLGNHGGPTPTHRLLPGSSAIDAGATATDPITNTMITTDQRGIARPQGMKPDIGAFEVFKDAMMTLAIDPATNLNGAAAELMTAIHAANDDPALTTITLKCGTYSYSEAHNWEFGPNALPIIRSPITIEGNGAVLDSTATTRLRFFYVAGNNVGGLATGTLTLQNLTLQNGKQKGGDSGLGGGGAGMGGAIFNHGVLTLERVTLRENAATGGQSIPNNGGGGGGGLGQDSWGNDGVGFGGLVQGSGGTGGAASNGGGGGVGGGGGKGDGGNGRGGGGGFGGGGGSSINEGGGSGGFGGGGGRGGGALGGFGGGQAGEIGGGGAGLGGAIFNHRGTLTLINCTLTANMATGGSSNHSAERGSGGSGFGAALFNLNGSVSIISSTFAGNTVTAGLGNTNFGGSNGQADGGAVYNLAYGNDFTSGGPTTAHVLLRNSILANSTGGSDLVNDRGTGSGTNAATVTFTDGNLVMTSTPLNNGATEDGPAPLISDPKLGALLLTTCKPAVLPLQANSPALNQATADPTITTDALGKARNQGNAPDLGAVEFSAAPSLTPSTTLTLNQASSLTNALLATVTDVDQDQNTLSVTATPVSGTGITLGTISVDNSGNVNPNVKATVTAGACAQTSKFKLKVTDNSGLSEEKELTITVNPDTTLPNTNLTGMPASVSDVNVSFTFSGTDNCPTNLTFQCKLDTGGWTNCTSGQSYTNLSSGQHRFQVKAIDARGNEDDSPASYTWTVFAASCGTVVNPVTMPAATKGVQFVQTLSASPTGSYVFSLLAGQLPPGINLVNTLGIYSLRGIPTTAGGYTFTIRAKKNNSTCEGARTYTVNVP